MTYDLTQTGFLLFLAVLVAILTRRLKMPYTVGLVLAGITVAMLHLPVYLQLSKDLIFSVFLPPLVFEAAFSLDWREFRLDLPVVGLLATVGMVLAAGVVAGGMHALLGWDRGSAALFGVLIAATDPVSVIALFKEVGVVGRMRVLLEGESLLNDATAAIGYVAVLAALTGAHQTPMAIAADLGLAIGGGAAIGGAIGWGCMQLAGRAADRLVEITLTVLAAYAAFFVAELCHSSGILATLTAGLVAGNSRAVGTKSADCRGSLQNFWEFAAFIANSLIFILIGIQVANLHLQGWWLPAAVAITLVTLGRAAAVYPLCALFAPGRLRIQAAHQHILVWGGLRGALALALALALPAALPDREAMVTITFAVVAFSVFAQGLTIRPLLRRLGQVPKG